jgi:isopenicillin-N epimerase
MLTPHGKQLFPLDEHAVYLDHGGYGVSPKEVLTARIEALLKIEKAPGPFFAFDCRPAWKDIAASVARRLSVRAEDLALVDNVTDGINAVLRSLAFEPNDQILITSVTYGAIANAARYIAGRHGAHVTEVALPFPNPDPSRCVDAIKAALSPRTKLAILDHITSATALVLPIAEMSRVCREHGVGVLIDGAHAPGNVALDIPSIGADWYAANLHKWCFVPRGCGFLWAARDRQKGLVPNVLSWDIDKPFPHSFGWTGTRDSSAWLSIPSAFAFMDRLGPDEILRHNHTLVREGIRLLAQAWKVDANTPDGMIGSMALTPLPRGLPFPATTEGCGKLQKTLWESHKIMASPSFVHDSRIWLRVSAQIYNQIDDYQKLAETIVNLAA